MSKPARLLLVQPAIQLVLAALGVLLVGWPILQIAGERGTAVLFVYVFGVWSALIVLLALVGRCIARATAVTLPRRPKHGGGR